MDRRSLFTMLFGSAVARKRKATVSGFANPIIGGGGGLVYPSIHSPNFQAGAAGWTINKDGSAEFNDVTVRGTIIAGHFIGNGQGQEVVIYSGPPAAGNLLASMVSAQVADIFGNLILPGFTVYGQAGAPLSATRIAEDGISFYTAATQAGAWVVKASIVYDTVRGELVLGQSSMIRDDWHSLGALGAHYVVTLGRYRLTADNCVELDIKVTGDGLQATAVSFANVLPAAYQPATTHDNLPMGTSRQVTAGDIWPRLAVNSAGVVTVTNQGTANIFAFCGKIPLD